MFYSCIPHLFSLSLFIIEIIKGTLIKNLSYFLTLVIIVIYKMKKIYVNDNTMGRIFGKFELTLV